MTRRVQFQRSSVTGTVPDELKAGTPAFNWADKRMWVGGPGDTPSFSIRKIDDWDELCVYRQGDFTIYAEDLYRARVDIPAGVGFRPSEWLQLTDTAADLALNNTDTGVIEGGAVSGVGLGLLTISEGLGIVVNREDPTAITVTVVEWGAFTLPVDLSELIYSASFFVGISAEGAAEFRELYGPARAIRLIPLAAGIVNRGTGIVDALWDTRIYSARTTDALRQTDQLYVRLAQPGGGGEMTALGGGLTFAIDGTKIVGRDLRPLDPSGNFVTNFFSAQSPATFSLLSLQQVVATGQTNVPVTHWDDGGVLTPLGASECAVHRVYMARDGVLYIVYGQKAYANLSTALQRYPVDIERRPNLSNIRDAIDPMAAAEVGVIYVTPECTDLADTTRCRIVQQRRNWLYQPLGGADGAYLPLDGSTPMAADLPLGGNALDNGDVDGTKVTIRPVSLAATGDEPSAPAARELQVNPIDGKVYQGSVCVADRTAVFDAANIYRPGDTCFQTNVLHRCTTLTGPGAFNAAHWQAIGTAAAVDSVVTAPTTLTRNDIDLTGNPAVRGIKVIPDASQSANIAEFGSAVIDQYGMGRGSLGSVVVRISQATHGFQYVGQPVAYNPGTNLWVGADASDLTSAGKALGVVFSVINADQFEVQFGGMVSDLETGAFVGGTIVDGLPYYVSATSAGKLTSVAPAAPNRLDPVMVAVSSTDGVLALTSAGDTTIEGGGQTFFQINQPAHGFTAATIGRAVYLTTGGVWTYAQADALTTVGVGVVQSIVDADNFVVNTAGLITSLAATAFEGSVAPSAGRFYYVSQTSAGLLTETAPSGYEHLNPILLALSSTAGVVLPWRPSRAPVERTGGEQLMEGPLRVANTGGARPIGWGGTDGNQHALTDNDGGGNAAVRFGHTYDSGNGLTGPEEPTQAGGAGVAFKAFVDSGNAVGKLGVLLLDDGTANGDGSLSEVAAAFFDYTGATDLPDGESVVTRARGDARYLQLATGDDPQIAYNAIIQERDYIRVRRATAGKLQYVELGDGMGTGPFLTFSSDVDNVKTANFDLVNGSVGQAYSFRNNGVEFANLQAVGTNNDGASLLTRSQLDARYGQLGIANEWTGTSTFTGTVLLNNAVTVSANLTMASSKQLRLVQGSAASPALAYSGDTNTGLYFGASGIIYVGLNGTQRYIFDNALNTNSVMRAGVGDGRYGRLASSNTWTDVNTFDGPVTITNTLNVNTVATFGTTTLLANSGFAFSEEVNTGMYKIASGQIAVELSSLIAYLFDNGSTTASVLRWGDARTTFGELAEANTWDGDQTFEQDALIRGQVLAAYGTAGSPGYSFEGDGTSGLYRVSAGVLGIALSGSLRYRLETAGGLASGTSVATRDAGDGRWLQIEDKPWVHVNGTTGANTRANGITSSRVSAGIYDLTFTTARSNASYGVQTTCGTSGSGAAARYFTSVVIGASKTVNGCRVQVVDINGTPVDPDQLYVSIED